MNEFLTLSEFEHMFNEFKRRKHGISAIINPFFDNCNLTKKEILELCQIGKFIWNINTSLSIYKKSDPPEPDFILKDEIGFIGLEHTRLLTKYAPQYLSLRNLIDDAATIFMRKYNENIFADIRFKDDNFSFKKSERLNISEEIADYVYSQKYGINRLKPLYLKNIKISKHSMTSFNYSENEWKHISLDKSTLNKCVKKKEEKIMFYKQSILNINEWWLVIVIDSLSSASYEYDKSVDYTINSMFDKVFIYRDFDEEIIQIK